MSEPGVGTASGISSEDVLILSERHPACRRREARSGFVRNVRTWPRWQGKGTSGSTARPEYRCAGEGRTARSSDEGPVMGLEQGAGFTAVALGQPATGGARGQGKAVRHPEAGGVGGLQACEGQPGSGRSSGQSIADFEADLSNNLYKLWNRPRQGAIFLRRCVGSIFRKQMAGHGHWVFQLSPTASPRRLPGATLSQFLGAAVPRRLLRLQARQICHRCRAHGSSALLALRLGARSRCSELLRQHRLGADAQGRPASRWLRHAPGNSALTLLPCNPLDLPSMGTIF